MKKVMAAGISVTSLITIALSCNQVERKTSVTEEGISQDSLIKRGHYLVTVMGCNDCHSPKVFGPNGPEPDTSRLLSGHPSDMPVAAIDSVTAKSWILFSPMMTATAGPWGISFSANLTPDATGIGDWTEERFSKALREGKSKGLDNNRTLLPPMPWPSYRFTNDEDTKAIFAYLKSIKPIKNLVPQPIPPAHH